MIIQGKAAVSNGKGTFSIEDIDVHPPQAGEVRVALKASGICHTDYDSPVTMPENHSAFGENLTVLSGQRLTGMHLQLNPRTTT